MRAQPGARLPAGLANPQASHYFYDGLAIQGAVLPRRTEALLRQSDCDLDRTVAFSSQRPEALTQLGVIAQVFRPLHRPCGDPSGHTPSDPFNGDVKTFTVPFTLHNHALDDLPHHLFAVDDCGRRRVPQGWDILCQLRDGDAFRSGEDARLRAQKPLVRLLQLALGGELVVPVLGQLPRYQAMLGFEQAIVTRGTFTFVGGALQALLPQPIECLALLFQACGGFQREAERRRFQRLEYPLCHERIDRLARDILTIGAAILDHGTGTDIAMQSSWPAVVYVHTVTAGAAD